jgi:hypothetical protein
MLLATADLAMPPIFARPPLAMPACYGVLSRIAPGAAILEAPQSPSQGDPLSAACGCWQSSHRHPTTAGYSGSSNAPYDSLITFPSPFSVDRLAEPGYLEHPDTESFDVFDAAGFSGSAWLFLTAHRLPYVMLHRCPGLSWRPVRIDRLEREMAAAKIYEAPDVILYETSRLALPPRPTLVCTEGWRLGSRAGRRFRVLPPKASLAAYNPDPGRDLVFTLNAAAVREARVVQLFADGEKVASWPVRPGPPRDYISPPFRLVARVRTLSLRCDGESRPVRNASGEAEGDGRAFSARVFSMSLRNVPSGPKAIGQRAAP